MISFQKVGTKNLELTKLQDNLDKTFKKIDELVDRRVFTVTLTTGSNRIGHGLGRVLIGWNVVRKRSGASIWDTQDSETEPSRFLSLECDADVSVDLMVF